MRLASLTLAALAAAYAIPARAAQPADTVYTFTGTLTATTGGATCVAGSPAAVTGDVLLSSHGYSELLHIKSSSATAAAALSLRSAQLPIVTYNGHATGPLSFVLVPDTHTYTGSFAATATKTSSLLSFNEILTLTIPPLIIGNKGNCVVTLNLTATQGVNKNLLKLLQGVL